MYDIAIVGAGPAGATLARLVGQTHKVLLLDRRDPASPWRDSRQDKCCGGLLAPDAQRSLVRQGLGLPRDILVGPQLFAVRAIDMDNSLERLYQRHYINMDRGKLDRWLVSLACGVAETWWRCRFEGFERQTEGFELSLLQAGKRRNVRAKWLVGADGATSHVRRMAFGRLPRPQKYVAIQEWFAPTDIPAYYTAVFDRHISDYYGWVIPKENGTAVGAALKPGPTALPKFERLKRVLCGLGYCLNRPQQREGCVILRPGRSEQLCSGANGVALLGEAAGFISPTSGEGLSYALDSAAALAKCFLMDRNNPLTHYEKACRTLQRNIAIKNIKRRVMYDPRLRRLAMTYGPGDVRTDEQLQTQPAGLTPTV